MLSEAEAAAYCGGKSVDWFETHVRVAPVRIGAKKLYDVRALDKFLDRLANPDAGPVTGDDWLARLDEGDGERP